MANHSGHRWNPSPQFRRNIRIIANWFEKGKKYTIQERKRMGYNLAMALPYLKVKPEDAIQILEKWIVKAYRIKTWIENSRDKFKRTNLWTENSQVVDAAGSWNKEWTLWWQGCQSDLFKIYVSSREVYNFGSLTVLVAYRNKDEAYKNILDDIDAKIAILNRYTDLILDRFNVQFSVQAGRDVNLQTGDSSKMEIKD